MIPAPTACSPALPHLILLPAALSGMLPCARFSPSPRLRDRSTVMGLSLPNALGCPAVLSNISDDATIHLGNKSGEAMRGLLDACEKILQRGVVRGVPG
jgi:hypothetical protein